MPDARPLSLSGVSVIAARVALMTLAWAALFGLWSLRIHAQNRIWPLVTHHVRVLLFVGVIVGWLVAATAFAPVASVVLVVAWLWEKADV